MAYDTFNYDIKKRMPEWWKEDTFLEPINRYSQELIRDLIGGLLGNFGVVQPFQVWKTCPTEYSWTHTYQPHDNLLKNKQGGTVPLILNQNEPIIVYFPNSKKNCHGVIQLKLEGDFQGLKKTLGKLTIKNANQKITINNITTTTDIKIFTEDNTILIDGVQRNDLVTGRFDKIRSQPRNVNYDEVDIDDENKITCLEIESDTTVNFSLKTKMIHPVYVTEQNIRIHTVSAFPIEWIRLYGFYCHDFNNKQEWRFLWEKEYKEEERVVYDRITKQFDCETFYVQVKLYGIGAYYTYGFPQEEFASNAAFQTNKNLDKWGKIYGLPRRYYKTNIGEDEEPYTYPPFYPYQIEQDYWYEERLVNEYRYNDDAINSSFIKDDNLNNVGILKCIDPRIRDIYVYTETIKSDIDNTSQTDEILPDALDEEGDGVTWQTPHEAANSNASGTEIILKPQSKTSFSDLKDNKTKTLRIMFKNHIPELPKNINIKGIELQLHGLTDIHSDSLILDDRSQMLLSNFAVKANGEPIKTIDHVQINNDIQYWEKGKGVYKIGGPNDLFGLSEIKRNQIQDGIEFQLGFTNLNEFLKATIVLYSIKLVIYYETIYDTYNFNVEFDRKQIILDDPEKQEIQMKINFENTGEIPIVNKNVYIATAKGIDITHDSFPQFDLDVDEKFTIGETDRDSIIITPTRYRYLRLQKNSMVSKEIDLTETDTISFYYRMNNYSTLKIFIENEELETIEDNSNVWKKYSYRLKKDQIDNLNDTCTLKVIVTDIEDLEGNVFIRGVDDWERENGVTISSQFKTGLYDIIVFCDEKTIKNTIIVKETELEGQ